MKIPVVRFILLLLVSVLLCPALISAKPGKKKSRTVEASCGTCNFGLKGESCALAVRFNGKAYFVDGTGIDDHGDAHASDGFCESIRTARVRGEVENGRFSVTSFRLLPRKKG
jgi:hypothetical protein